MSIINALEKPSRIPCTPAECYVYRNRACDAVAPRWGAHQTLHHSINIALLRRAARTGQFLLALVQARASALGLATKTHLRPGSAAVLAHWLWKSFRGKE